VRIETTTPFWKGSVNEIVIFFAGAHSAVSIPGDEDFMLTKDLPLDGPKPGSSLFSLEGLLGHGPP
jgi:hypothetical protein